MNRNVNQDISLAAVHSGELNRELLLAFAQDLETCARIVSVHARIRARDQPTAHVDGVQHAVQQLLAGAISALQIRYEFDDMCWTDTIMHAHDGFRLIRVPSTES